MPPVEVDERELGYLRNTANILGGMMKNPKTRRKILEAYKEVVPNAPVPELDATHPLEERIGGIEKAVIDFITEQREERQKDKTETKLAEIRAQVEGGRQMLRERGYTEDGIKQLEDFRDQKGLVDYNDAVRLYELDHAPPRVAEPDARMSLFQMQNADNTNDFYKRLWDSQGEDSSAVNKMAYDTIAEMRGGYPRR